MSAIQPAPLSLLVRRYRTTAGLTQEELARRAGVSPRSVSDVERGVSRWPHPDTISRLADALALDAGVRATLESAARRRGAPVDGAPARPRQSLARPLTPLIGREHDEAALIHLLRQPAVRLITLTGAPGSGKTRLGVQVALEAGGEMFEETLLFELAATRDPDQALVAIAQALGASDSRGRSALEAIIIALGDRRALLMLDNLEQVLAIGPSLVTLLSACPAVKLLTTSREPLRVRGEQEYAVPPLAVPDPARLPALDDLNQYPSVALFTLRARGVKPTFALTLEQAPAVAAICARLDGLPLAIELAAARVKLMAPTALLARLDHRLALLDEGARDLPERQRTLRDAIAWSHDLLDERERRVFRRLAVFAGGWTLDAVEAVCGVSEEPARAALPTVSTLASLLDKSLVAREDDLGGEPRYHLLETLREFALERLEASGEAEALRRRHAAYMADLAERAVDELRGPHQAAWLARLDRESDNARAALDWAVARGEAEAGLRLAFGLYYWWQRRGRLRAGQHWLDTLFALPAARQPARWRARALFALAACKLWQIDASGFVPLEECIALSRELGDLSMLADALHAEGMAEYELGHVERARALLDESLEVALTDGYVWCASQTRWTLGEIAYTAGDYERAMELNSASLAGFQQVGDVSYIAMLTLRQGYIVWAQGDRERAAALFHEALRLTRDASDEHRAAECLEAIGVMLVEQGRSERATRLLGAVARQRAISGAPALPTRRAALDRAVVTLRAALGDAPFAAAWAAGGAESLGRLVGEVESE